MKVQDIHGKLCDVAIEQRIEYWENCGSIGAPLPYPERIKGLTHTTFKVDGREVLAAIFKELFPDLVEKFHLQ